MPILVDADVGKSFLFPLDSDCPTVTWERAIFFPLQYTFSPLDAAKSDTLDAKRPTAWIYCSLQMEHGKRNVWRPRLWEWKRRRDHSAACWRLSELFEPGTLQKNFRFTRFQFLSKVFRRAFLSSVHLRDTRLTLTITARVWVYFCHSNQTKIIRHQLDFRCLIVFFIFRMYQLYGLKYLLPLFICCLTCL